jgi:hypothetical protein
MEMTFLEDDHDIERIHLAAARSTRLHIFNLISNSKMYTGKLGELLNIGKERRLLHFI